MSTFNKAEISSILKWLGSGSINLFGRPFAGKDTQGAALADLLNAPLIGGGDILRSSVIPERSKEALRKGLLVPTEDYVNIVLPYLRSEEFLGKPLVLSSVGRWSGEEANVVAATNQAGHPMKAVFYLNVSEDEVKKRWQASQDKHPSSNRADRHDDVAEILDKRLEEFREKTLPVIEYYRQAGLLYEIDAERHSAEVTAEMLRILFEKVGQ